MHLFPSTDSWIEVHPALRNVTLHHTGFRNPARNAKGVRFRGVSLAWRAVDVWRRKVRREEAGTRRRAERLARLVARLSPDVVHSLGDPARRVPDVGSETTAGQAVPSVDRHELGKRHLPFRATRRARAEDPGGPRRVRLLFLRVPARRRPWRNPSDSAGTVLPVFPNAGGFDLAEVACLRQPGPASARRAIMLKGYQHWGGRALTGLRALERCADLLGGYEVWIYSATPDVAVAAELFAKSTGIRVTLLPKATPHSEILSRHGRARISIGLSISDAISTSLLEAMVMGCLPDPVVDRLRGRMDRRRAHGSPGSSGRSGDRRGGDPQSAYGRRVGRPREGGESPDGCSTARSGAAPSADRRDLQTGGSRDRVAVTWHFVRSSPSSSPSTTVPTT